MSPRRIWLPSLLAAFALAGCPGTPTPPDDTGVGDTGATDARLGDAGDTGPRPDGGLPDLDGALDPDGGVPDDVGPLPDAPAICGDGFTEGAEDCDDGDVLPGDGCSATCTEEAGYDCSTGVCLTVCGDAMTIGAEECDDGNAVTETCAYGETSCMVCDSTCATVSGATSLCGDDSTDAANEACDDGNTATETACAYGTATCTACDATCDTILSLTGPVCGDSNTDPTETCDDGNTTAGDGCSATCQVETVCGNSVITPPETCDDGNAVTEDCTYGATSCTVCTATCQNGPGIASYCGDGGIDAANELCDDGNAITDTSCAYGTATCVACDATCANMLSLTGPYCGDRTVTASAGETCDDGNTVAGDGCDATCRREAICGDLFIVAPETCDDGNNVTETCAYGLSSCTVCTASCQTGAGLASFCGDMVVQSGNGESCDDGNADPLDGCASCRTVFSEVEPNEDGTPSTGGSGIGGNDFDVAGGVAVTNANANLGVIPLRASDPSSNLVAASFAVAGDEDVFAVLNDTAGNVRVRVETWSLAAGAGVGATTCGAIDTGVNLRNAAGTVLASDDDGGVDACSNTSVVVAPGQRIYVHVTEFGDNATISAYAIQLTYTAIPCGDGVIDGEACDDGNTANGDGCSSTCQVESGYNCSGTPSTCVAQLPNSTCGSAVDLGTGGTATGVNLSRGGTSPAATSCNTTAGLAAFYSVTIPAGFGATVTATATGATATNLILEVLDSCAATACSATRNATTTGAETLLVPNGTASSVTRIIAVSSSSLTVAGTFDLTVTTAALCGNGATDVGETCDDANTASSDGCSSTCQVEAGFGCTGAPSVCVVLAPNATCAGAIDLGTSGTATGANIGRGGASPNGTSCNTTTNLALYYQITIPPLSQSTLTATPSGSTNIILEAIDTCAATACTATSNVTTSGAESIRLSNTTTGPITRIVAVGSSSTTVTDTVSIAVTSSPLAANAGCSGAIDLGTGGTRTGQALTGGGASPNGTGCNTTDGATLWYQVTVPPVSATTIVATPTGTPSTNLILETLDACASTSCLANVNAVTTGAETITVTNTTAGPLTRFVAVSSSGTAPLGTFDITATSAPIPYTTIPVACVDMTGATAISTPTLDDDISATTALPFSFSLYGSTVTHFAASTNGWAAFFTSSAGTAADTRFNARLPTTATPNGMLAPFWDDLVMTAGSLRTLTTGTAGSRRTTIEWAGSIFGATATVVVQLQIVEGGPIEFHYCSATGDAARTSGSSATVGVENLAGTVGYTFSSDTSGAITPGTTAIRWTIP